ncbi:Fic family protein [uncultured Helicobacter sp.]|uniref:Fic family protein n=1 Tax=uncultured Helicobacter sp. TaxID=175537 RepID=UPI00261A6737|nr:Fic family protein [uncultured Helicobacter sp.]
MGELEEILDQIDTLKFLYIHYQNLHPSFDEDFKLRYTYESNAIEGNTLTLIETKVVLEGVAIGEKSLREHYEVINHHQALALIEVFGKNPQPLSDYEIKSIHSLILKNIDENNAGAYRNCEVRISGAMHIPPDFFSIPSLMQDFIKDYHSLQAHPVIKASRAHCVLVGIHPFVDGNGRTSRLVMNLELLKSGYPLINIKSQDKSEYYQALDLAHTQGDYSSFDLFVAKNVLDRLKEIKRFCRL